MAVVPAFVSLRDWRFSLYRGEAYILDRFLAGVDATMPPGWIRDREYELTRMRPERVRCYLFDSVGDAAVRVWLQRVTDTRVRGGPVQALRHPSPGDAGRIGQLVTSFAEGCVVPIARVSGVRHSRPTFGPRSVVTSDAEVRFIRLADTADGVWPLTDPTQVLWDELISVCLAEQVAIDRDELGRWFADSGWEPEAAASLTDRFFADSEWVAKRLAVIAP